ncbi:MAG: NAD(P)H-dependent oxidoreductase [Clostridiaceae bacterium]|jgi:multimeric flavodoxin WrbA|nr:NAD(P)H-dependent oxidoreductase [Clostridiaceae bacterium]
MKKILAIIGSPRKGETYNAVMKFEKALNDFGPAEVEYIMLSSIALQDCTGCHNCILKGRESCRETLKVRELQDKLLSADAVILASPVYNQHVTALMKKFLDYFTFLWHRPEMFDVKFFGISSGGGIFKEVFKLLRSNVESWGGTWVGELGVPHYDSLTAKFRKKCDRDFNKKAGMLTKAMEVKKRPVPGIGRLMMFNIWKMNAKAGKDYNPADYAYWSENDLFDKDFYYPVKINIFVKTVTGIIFRIARSFMKKVYVGYDEV